jgi:RND family efflux transporter MFP subunit
MSDEHVEVQIREPDEKIGWGRRIVRAVIVIAVLFAGVSIMMALIASKPKAGKKSSDEAAPIVEVAPAPFGDQEVDVVASGVVVPARQVLIATEVGGRVTWISPELEPGGRFATGKPLLRVDARDYQLAVQQQSAQVTLAETELEVEKSRRRVAEKEWEAFGEQPPEGSVAKRDPQIKAAEGAVKAARSGLRRSKLAVSKTGLVAPFNAMVRTRQVDLGQLVAPGSPLATLVGTDAFWVQVSVPVERLGRIKIPGIDGVKPDQASTATIEQRFGEQVVRRTGKVVRLAGDVDPVGRMARVLIEIPDPLGLKSPDPGPPLLLEMYVDVTIDGGEVTGVSEVPRLAMHDEETVWILDGEVLRVKQVEVVWRKRDTVLVRGLPPGAQVITSPVPGAVDGMAVRQREASEEGTAKAVTP